MREHVGMGQAIDGLGTGLATLHSPNQAVVGAGKYRSAGLIRD